MYMYNICDYSSEQSFHVKFNTSDWIFVHDIFFLNDLDTHRLSVDIFTYIEYVRKSLGPTNVYFVSFCNSDFTL